MYKKVLVPLDGSELAEVVFTYVKELAGRMDTDVILLQVSRRADDNMPMRQAYLEQSVETILQQSRQVQQKTSGKKRVKRINVRGEVAAGYAADEIISMAEREKVDLIMMATHGRSGIRHWAMGSVAEKIMRAATIPVWLVRASDADQIPYDQWPKLNILVPLDGSERAEVVLPHAEALAKQRGIEQVEVVLIRVHEPISDSALFLSEPGVSYAPLTEADTIGAQPKIQNLLKEEMAKGKQIAADYLANIEKRFRDKDISVRSEVLEGKANEIIVDYANEEPFNLIVMSTHRRSGLSRLVYGSTTENILHGVNCPVLMIRTD